MNINQFAKMCTVWHLGDFWHIHVNLNAPLWPVTKSAGQKVMTSMQQVSSNTAFPIRWSSYEGPTVWMTNGKVHNPFGADAYGGSDGYWLNVMPTGDHTIIGSSLDPNNGMLELGWSSPRPNNRMIYQHSQYRSAASSIHDYNSKITAYGDIKDRDESVNNLPIDSADMVQYYSAVISYDRNFDTRSPACNLTVSHNKQRDIDVIEQGSIVDGVPRMDRFIRKRILQWGGHHMNQQINQPLHRPDGPAIVNLLGVTETILGSTKAIQITDHTHEWRLHGTPISQSSIVNWCHKHGVVMRNEHHGDKHSFIDEMDRMAFIADPPQ